MSQRDIGRELKKRILAVRSVEAVGVRGPDGLPVYLKEEDPDARRAVARLLDVEAPGTTARFVLSGTFRAFKF